MDVHVLDKVRTLSSVRGRSQALVIQDWRDVVEGFAVSVAITLFLFICLQVSNDLKFWNVAILDILAAAYVFFYGGSRFHVALGLGTGTFVALIVLVLFGHVLELLVGMPGFFPWLASLYFTGDSKSSCVLAASVLIAGFLTAGLREPLKPREYKHQWFYLRIVIYTRIGKHSKPGVWQKFWIRRKWNLWARASESELEAYAGYHCSRKTIAFSNARRLAYQMQLQGIKNIS